MAQEELYPNSAHQAERIDFAPESLYNKWIKDRMEFYKRVEPCAAPRDEKLELVGKLNSNNLGTVSDALWGIILSNEEIAGHQGQAQKVVSHVTRLCFICGFLFLLAVYTDSP